MKGDTTAKTFFPLMYVLITHHLDMFKQNRNWPSKETEAAISSMHTLIEAFRIRLCDLRRIWRGQGHDVRKMMRYYANGMFENYFKVPSFKLFYERDID